jgi:hypothetical protein
MRRVASIALVIGLSVASCILPTEPWAELSTVLEVSSLAAAPSDTLTLRVLVTNRGRRDVRPDVGCAPGADVEVRSPSGDATRLLEGLVFTCPVLDSQILTPGETDTVRLVWPVPRDLGRYQFRGGVPFTGRLVARSPIVTVSVR